MSIKKSACCTVAALCVLPAWAGTEGAGSTFYGQNAGLSALHDYNDNTFIGANAGSGTTSGDSNVFVGWDAGSSNITGNYNSYFGTLAGQHSTGSGNSFFGYAAGNVNAASDNTFFGASAGITNTSGAQNTFLGSGAGISNSSGYYGTFVGSNTGQANNTGVFNTAIGTFAGSANADGGYNTYLGAQSGESNVSGNLNVFIGNAAGYSETGSNKLYIDNCMNSAPCTPPFIYGEFDHHLLKINGVLNVRANDVAKSQMHFSKGDTNTGGWITSVLDNNFFLSSGASFDATAGNWTQRSPDNSAIIAGSGSLGYRIFANSGNTVGVSFTPTVRLHINYNGELGLNQLAVAGTPIQHSSGAHLTAGGVWTDASSREYKEHIRPLTSEEAMQAFAGLTPVRYNYKADVQEQHVGFIAEDVPPLVATPDRKSLSPMDIVAVLTKVVGEQNRTIEAMKERLAHLEDELRARSPK